MTDDERAKQLARAIDDLISGTESPGESHGLDDDELEALLRVAEERIQAGRERREAGSAHEGEVWKRLSERLSQQAGATPDVDIPREQHDALRDIVSLRMQMATEVFEIAEAHRDEVWERVQSRLGGVSSKDIPVEARDEAEVEALTRRSLNRLAEIASDPVENRFRERLRRDTKRATDPPPPKKSYRLSIALGLATIMLAVVSLAPLPFTGFAGHPFVEFAESAADQIGLAAPEAAAERR